MFRSSCKFPDLQPMRTNMVYIIYNIYVISILAFIYCNHSDFPRIETRFQIIWESKSQCDFISLEMNFHMFKIKNLLKIEFVGPRVIQIIFPIILSTISGWFTQLSPKNPK